VPVSEGRAGGCPSTRRYLDGVMPAGWLSGNVTSPCGVSGRPAAVVAAAAARGA